MLGSEWLWDISFTREAGNFEWAFFGARLDPVLTLTSLHHRLCGVSPEGAFSVRAVGRLHCPPPPHPKTVRHAVAATIGPAVMHGYHCIPRRGK